MKQSWENVWYIDEKNFNMDGPDCLTYYFHNLRKEKRIASHRQQGEAVVIFLPDFVAVVKTPICFMKGNQDSKYYQKLLIDNFLRL